MEPFLLLSNTTLMARTEMQDPNFGLLRINRESLAVTWLMYDVSMNDTDVCGIEPTSLQGQRTACAHSPRLKTSGGDNSTAAVNSSAASGAQQLWTLQVHHTKVRSGRFYSLGFASGASKVATTQAVLWPYTAMDFINKPAVYGAGPPVTWLPPHLRFVTGLRLHKQGPNVCSGSLIGST